jgi:hypothetical protein
VGGLERFGDLLRHRQRFVRVHRPARQPLGEVITLDQLHDERAFFEAVDVRDVGMIERRQDFRFALESRQPLAIVGDISGQDLEGDLALQLRIPRPIHLAHSAGT